MSKLSIILICIGVFLLISTESQAALNTGTIGVNIVQKYQDAARSFGTTIVDAANRLFWTFALLSLVARLMKVMLSGGIDIGEILEQLIYWIIVTGIFSWLLNNGTSFASAIVNGLGMLGIQAGGLNGSSPTQILDIGFTLLASYLNNLSLLGILFNGLSFDQVFSGILVLVILAMCAYIFGVVVYTLCASWLYIYAGVFVVGFGGGEWLRDIAVNYYRQVIGLGLELMMLMLLVGTGQSLIISFQTMMSAGTVPLTEYAAMFAATFILLLLVKNLPGRFSQLVGSGSIGGNVLADKIKDKIKDLFKKD